MDLKARPCTLADIVTELKVWQVWTVKEDGSPRDLDRTGDVDDFSADYWHCRNCLAQFISWLEVQEHLAAEKTLMAAVV